MLLFKGHEWIITYAEDGNVRLLRKNKTGDIVEIVFSDIHSFIEALNE